MQTKIEVEAHPGLARAVTISVPAESIETQIKTKFQELSPKLRINGFRPGKIPESLAKKRFGPSVRQEVLDTVMQDTYKQALSEQKLSPVAKPDIEVVQNKPGADFIYKILLEVYPDFQLQTLTDKAVTIYEYQVDPTQKDIDKAIAGLRREKATWQPADRPSQKGDKIVVSFSGKADEKVLPSCVTEEAEIVLGEGQLLPDFESALLGRSAEESFQFNFTFPKTHVLSNLREKQVMFDATVHQVQAPILPALDESFMEKLDIKAEGLDGLREYMRQHMQKDITNKVRAHIREQIVTQMLAHNPLELPKALINKTLKTLHEANKDYLQYLRQSGASDSELSKTHLAIAKRRVHWGLIVEELIETQQLSVTSHDVDQWIVAQSDTPSDDSKAHDFQASLQEYYQKNPHFNQQIKNVILQNKLFDYLQRDIQLVKQAIDYAEFTQLIETQEST